MILSRKNKTKNFFAIILVLLCTSLLFRLVYTQWIHPAPFYVYYDPEMAYYFSSLSYLNGAPLVYIDHPGTPVEILGSLFFLSTYPITHRLGMSLVDFHLLHPEIFLSIARMFITLACITSMVFLAFTFFLRRKELSYALLAISLAALYFTVHPMAINMAVAWSHNAFNLPVGALLLVLLYRVLREDRQIQLHEIVLLGAATGLLTAVTIYFVSWVISFGLAFSILALLRRDGVDKAVLVALITGISSLAGFGLATFPMAATYPLFAKWVSNLLIHQGRYGSGEIGMVPPGEMGERLLGLFQQAPGVAWGTLLAFFLVLVVLWYQKNSSSWNKGIFAFILAVFIQLIIALIIVAKHPGLIYLLAVAAILPPLIGAAFDFLDRCKSLSPAIPIAFSVIVLSAFTHAWILSIEDHRQKVSDLSQSQLAIESQLENLSRTLGKPRENLEVLWTYGIYNACFARWFGNDYGANALSISVRKICPQDWLLNVFNGHVNTGSEYLPFSESEWDVVVIRSKILEGQPLDFNLDYRIEESTIQFPDDYGSILFIIPFIRGRVPSYLHTISGMESPAINPIH